MEVTITTFEQNDKCQIRVYDGTLLECVRVVLERWIVAIYRWECWSHDEDVMEIIFSRNSCSREGPTMLTMMHRISLKSLSKQYFKWPGCVITRTYPSQWQSAFSPTRNMTFASTWIQSISLSFFLFGLNENAVIQALSGVGWNRSIDRRWRRWKWWRRRRNSNTACHSI